MGKGGIILEKATPIRIDVENGAVMICSTSKDNLTQTMAAKKKIKMPASLSRGTVINIRVIMHNYKSFMKVPWLFFFFFIGLVGGFVLIPRTLCVN